MSRVPWGKRRDAMIEQDADDIATREAHEACLAVATDLRNHDRERMTAARLADVIQRLAAARRAKRGA